MVWVLAVLVLLVAVFYLGGGWYFAGMLRDRALDGEQRRQAMAPDFDYEVLAFDGQSITLRNTDGENWLGLPGRWGVRGFGGYGFAGEVLSSEPGRATRLYQHLAGDLPAPGDLVAFETRAWPDDPAALPGLAPRSIQVAGPLGDYPAWLFEGDGSRWAVLVHGYGMDPLENARLVPALLEEGFTAMLITLRNDPGAPEDPSGMLRYGLTEWEDLAAAVRHALAEGAEEVALVGVSMGGGVIVSFLYESELREAVGAVVLDAPMLDFGQVVDHQASQEDLPLVDIGVPGSLTAVAKWWAGLRFDVDWEGLDYLSRTAELNVPILLLHGNADDRIPLEISEQLRDARPDLVTFVEVEDAPHMGAWNVDPARYEALLVDFLRAH